MDQALLDAVRTLVNDLADGRLAEIEADGRIGRLSRVELATAIADYGRRLLPLPDAGVGLIDIYPRRADPTTCSLDVPLWTAEEGRSDLTLCLFAKRHSSGYRLEITGLDVL